MDVYIRRTIGSFPRYSGSPIVGSTGGLGCLDGVGSTEGLGCLDGVGFTVGLSRVVGVGSVEGLAFDGWGSSGVVFNGGTKYCLKNKSVFKSRHIYVLRRSRIFHIYTNSGPV